MPKKGADPGVQVGSNADQKSTGEIKKIPPFRYGKAPNEPGMPCLSIVPIRPMLRGEHSRSSAAEVSSPDNVRREMGEIRRECMSPEDREQFYSFITITRENAITCLDTLVRYDECLTMKEAEYLQHCAGIIQCAEVIQP